MTDNKLADTTTECAVLAGICKHGKDALLDISGIVSTDTLTLEVNKILYKCITNAFKTTDKIDIPTLYSSATELGLYELLSKDNQLEYVRSLFNYPIDISNVSILGKKLAKLEIARNLQGKIREIYKDLNDVTGSESVDHILSIAEKPILDFGNNINQNDEQPLFIGENIREYVNHLKTNQNSEVGIPSGFSRYDAAIGGGFRRKTVSLVGARVKQGKSIFADNVAIHVAGRLGIPVLMIDTEMNTQDHQNRLLAYHTKIAINKIERGEFSKNPILSDKIDNAVTKIEKMPYMYKNVSGKGFSEILSIIHRWIMRDVGIAPNGRTNNCLVIYDYFKLMTSEAISGNMAEFQVLGFQVSELHNFCVKYDIPVFSFVQLNRDGILKESTDVVSQSDRLLWLCTNFSIFKEKTDDEIVEDGDEWGNRKLIPLIARHGPALKTGDYINMSMQGEYAMLEELRTRFEIAKSNNDDGQVNFETEVPFE